MMLESVKERGATVVRFVLLAHGAIAESWLRVGNGKRGVGGNTIAQCVWEITSAGG